MVRTPGTLTAVICEDDTAVASALVDTLNGLYGFDVVASVESAADAVTATEQAQPDIVVVDLSLSAEAGLRIVTSLQRAAPDCAVVVVVPPPFGRLRASAERAGAMALVELTDLRPLRHCLEQLHTRSHVEPCPCCPTRLSASTASTADQRRPQATIRAGGVVRPGLDPATGGGSSSTQS